MYFPSSYDLSVFLVASFVKKRLNFHEIFFVVLGIDQGLERARHMFYHGASAVFLIFFLFCLLSIKILAFLKDH
jgi:hypothetical protein